MKKIILATTALAMAIAAPAFAGTDMTVDEAYAKYDTNKDGSLDKAEFDKKMADHDMASESTAKFAMGDTNKDGMISKAEMTAWKAKKDSM